MQLEHEGLDLSHFRFPCLQNAHAFIALEACAQGLKLMVRRFWIWEISVSPPRARICFAFAMVTYEAVDLAVGMRF